MARRRAVAIVNPATGHRATQALLEQVRAVASGREVALDVCLTQRAGHAIELARGAADSADLLLAIGGDGTVSDVITGALEAGTPIGIIPAGSTNMVAKDLGVPLAPRAATLLALAGEPRAFDVARAGRTTFVHMAGAGFDAEIMRRASSKWKRRVGWAAYLPPAVRQLRYPTFEATIVVDGAETRLPARVVLLALGGSFIAPWFRVGDGINRHDGFLDVCVFNPPNLPATLGTLAWIALGSPTRSRWQHQLRGRRVELCADRPVPFEVDGDYLGELPMVVEMLDRPARIVVPDGKRA